MAKQENETLTGAKLLNGYDNLFSLFDGRVYDDSTIRTCIDTIARHFSKMKIRKIIKKDIDFLDHIQMEMSTARQFLFIARLKNAKEKLTFESANRIEKTNSEQGIEVRRMRKSDIKRFLAL